jgi:hypothetical protein
MTVGMVCDFATKEPSLTVIISLKFVSDRLSFAPSAEAKFWRPHVSRLLRDGNTYDTKADSTRH